MPISFYCFYFPHRIFPESARWLAVKGQLTEAHAVLMMYANKNSKAVDSDSVQNDLAEYYHSEVESQAKVSSRKSFLELIRTPRLRKRTVILCYNW